MPSNPITGQTPNEDDAETEIVAPAEHVASADVALDAEHPVAYGGAFEQVAARMDALSRQAGQLTEGSHRPGTDIVASRSADPVVARRQLAALRSEATKMAAKARAQGEELQALAAAQVARAEEIANALATFTAEVEQKLFTINLYLGRDEELVLLRDGESASEQEPITLRQMLLFMDEECAAYAENGGIKIVQMETFDRWLLENPAHLDQVLPERKGVVALRPRRQNHEDKWSERDAAENRKTYWLIRNGERLYRVVTELQAGMRILPLADEWERLFSRTSDGYRTALIPGSYEWEQAQEQAADLERGYMRVGLILEGLLHRTPAFHPLPPQGVSFLDPLCVRDGRVRYITDAEGFLGSGSETFQQWRRRLISELRPGMRLILGPGLHRHNYKDRAANHRLTPSVATLPATETVYTIEQRYADGALLFRYHEGPRYVGDTAWGGGEYRSPKRRATAKVFPTDSFVLPFDLARVEDMKRFLASRADRHLYVEMFPILKAAIAAKEREAQVEAPFCTMLAGVLARENDVTVADAQEAIPDLVSWWKLKNRFHRPLLLEAAHPDLNAPDEADLLTPKGRQRRSSHAQEELKAAQTARQRAQVEAAESAVQAAKATRMILAEHARRVRAQARGSDPVVVDALRAAHPVALLIARPRRGGYIVLDPAEPITNVFVHESEYTAKGVLKTRREWVMPGVSRPQQWMTVHHSERWDLWDLAADERVYLRGPERDTLIEQMITAAKHGGALALTFDGKRFNRWTAKHPQALLDPARPATAKQHPPKLQNVEQTWRRDRGRVRLTGGVDEHKDTTLSPSDTLPWKELEPEPFYIDEEATGLPKRKLLWHDEAAITRLQAQRELHRAADKRQNKMCVRISALVESVREQWFERQWAAEHARFMDDFGDPALWPAHRKSKEPHIRFPSDWNLGYWHRRTYPPTTLWDAVALLVENDDDPAGRTVAEALIQASNRYGAREAVHRGDSGSAYRYTAPRALHEYVLRDRPPDQDDHA